MRGLIGIDAGVLDNCFGRICFAAWAACCPRAAALFTGAPKKRGTVKKYVQVSAARHFHTGHSRNSRQRIGNFLREISRGLFQAFRQFKAERRGGFAHGKLGRALGNNGNVRFVPLMNVVAQRFANPVVNRLVHRAPSNKRV